MITRAYQNANGKRQEITLSPEEWDSLSESDLNRILGFDGPKVAEEAKKPAKAAKAKKPSKVVKK